jgi:hypothetical protein
MRLSIIYNFYISSISQKNGIWTILFTFVIRKWYFFKNLHNITLWWFKQNCLLQNMFQIIKEIFCFFFCRGQYNCNLTCFCSVDIWNHRSVEPSHIYLLTYGGIMVLTNYSDGTFPMNILIYISDLKIKQNPLQAKRNWICPTPEDVAIRRCRH